MYTLVSERWSGVGVAELTTVSQTRVGLRSADGHVHTISSEVALCVETCLYATCVSVASVYAAT